MTEYKSVDEMWARELIESQKGPRKDWSAELVSCEHAWLWNRAGAKGFHIELSSHALLEWLSNELEHLRVVNQALSSCDYGNLSFTDKAHNELLFHKDKDSLSLSVSSTFMPLWQLPELVWSMAQALRIIAHWQELEPRSVTFTSREANILRKTDNGSLRYVDTKCITLWWSGGGRPPSYAIKIDAWLRLNTRAPRLDFSCPTTFEKKLRVAHEMAQGYLNGKYDNENRPLNLLGAPDTLLADAVGCVMGRFSNRYPSWLDKRLHVPEHMAPE